MLTHIKYDTSGKLVLRDVYNEANPISYFSELANLNYEIPQNAKPIFQKLINALRKEKSDPKIKIIDVGSSYGVNGALLKHNLNMKDLYQLYDHHQNTDPALLFIRDMMLYAEPYDADLEIVGIDPAKHAIDYAVKNGLLDEGITTNLEKFDPTSQDLLVLENTDLIISTGCFGYVTDKTLERLLNANGDHRPWMAHFVLRMFDFEVADNLLKKYGYCVEKHSILFRQRQFVSKEEQANVLENLAEMNINTHNAEENGWYMAQLFVARPQQDAGIPLHKILGEATH